MIELIAHIESRAIIMASVKVMAFSTAAYSGQPCRKHKFSTVTTAIQTTTPTTAPPISLSMISPDMMAGE
jgi:hypothetical protein